MTIDLSSSVVDETMEFSIDLRVAIPLIAAATALAVDALPILSRPSAPPPLPHASTLAKHTINHSTATWGVADVRPM